MKKEVDNLLLIAGILKFDSPDDFYYLQIIQRKKENKNLGSNSRVIKNYYITSVAHLSNRYEEIKDLCRTFNARACIRLNRRSFEKVAFKSLTNVANTISNKDFSSLKGSYDRACGTGHNEPNKTWILDIDGKFTTQKLSELENVMEKASPEGDKVLYYISSKTGVHIITKPFDCRVFREKFPDIEIHKDNPTNLFIP
jgi:hypothetical protein